MNYKDQQFYFKDVILELITNYKPNLIFIEIHVSV